jgi:Zn-finger nucleic acid-binding protein
MTEMLHCPACGVDRAMAEEMIWGARGWRCPDCGHVWLPGTEVSRDTGNEQAVHQPQTVRSEDD